MRMSRLSSNWTMPPACSNSKRTWRFETNEETLWGLFTVLWESIHPCKPMAVFLVSYYCVHYHVLILLFKHGRNTTVSSGTARTLTLTSKTCIYHSKKSGFYLFVLYMYACFAACMCTMYACLEPEDARRGCCIPTDAGNQTRFLLWGSSRVTLG